MATEILKRDADRIPVGGGVTDNADQDITMFRFDPTTLRLKVDSVGDTTQFAEDVAHTSGDEGTMALAVRNDAIAALAGTDGDYAPLQVNADGALYSEISTALPAGTNAIGKLAANSGVDIGDVDILSVIPGTGASNLGKAEDAVHSSGDVGVMMLVVRQDSQVDFAADGDYVPLSVNAAGALRATGGTEYTEDEVSANPIVGGAVVMERDDALSTVTPAEADNIGLRGTAEGALWTQDFNSDDMLTALQLIDNMISGSEAQVDIVAALPAGTNAIGKLAANSGVDIGDVDVLSLPALATGSNTIGEVTIGLATTAATDLAKAEDAAHASGDVGIMALSVRQDTAAALSGLDADYQPLITDANGRLHVLDANSASILTSVQLIDDAISGSEMQVDVVAALPAGTNAIGKLAANSGVDIGDVDVLSLPNVTIGTMADLTESLVDDNAFTPATSRVLPVGFTFDDTTPDSVDEGDIGAARMSANRNIYTTLRDAAGNERGANVNASNELSVVEASAAAIKTAVEIIDNSISGSETQVDVVAALPAGTNAIGKLAANSGVDIGDVDVLSLPALATGSNTIGEVTIGAATTAAGDLAKAEDAVHASADVGIQALAVRKATPANLSGTDGDYEPLQVDGGRLWASTLVTGDALTALQLIDDMISGSEAQVDVVAALPAGTNAIGKLAANSGVDIGDIDILSIATGTNTIGAVVPKGATAGGGSTFNSTDLDESEEEVKGTAGTIYSIYAWNLTAVPLWLKVFNATAANVTVGTTSADYDIMIPANADSDGAGFVIPIPAGGWPLSTAITLAITTGRGVTDSGAPGTGDAGVLVFYT